MERSDWIAQCAARLRERTGMDYGDAMVWADALYDETCNDPEAAADDELDAGIPG